MNESDRYGLERMAEMGSLLLKTIDEEGIAPESLRSDYGRQWLVSTPALQRRRAGVLPFQGVQGLPSRRGVGGRRRPSSPPRARLRGDQLEPRRVNIETDLPELVEAVRGGGDSHRGLSALLGRSFHP